MANDTRIRNLTAATSIAGTDELVLDQGSGAAKRVSINEVVRASNLARGRFNVRDYNASPTASAATNASAFAACMAAANDNGIVEIPAGRYQIAGGLVLDGLSCSFEGQGLDTILQFTSQTGPCLDFEGYEARNGDFQFGQHFHNFCIEGDNTADATGTHCGLYFESETGAAIANLSFKNISIRFTGGPAIKATSQFYFNHFENIDVQAPVSANTYNWPYIHLYGLCNGNQFTNTLLRNMENTTDAAGGVVRIERDPAYPTFGVYAPSGNRFYGITTENLKIPDGGQVIYCQGISNTFDGYMPYDTATTATDADDTCHIRLIGPDTGSVLAGGNVIQGVIPGGFQTGYAVPRYGVIVNSNRECIIGVAGYAGNNVKLVDASDQNYVNIGGLAEADWSANTPITDASSGTKNVLLDNVALRWVMGGGVAGATAKGVNFYKALGNAVTGLTQGHLTVTTLTQPHSGGGSIVYGLNNQALGYGSNAMNTLLALYNLAASSNTTGELTNLIGMLCDLQSLGAGAISAISGVQVGLTASGAGDVTTYKAIDVTAPSVAGGPVATAYGLYLAAQKQTNVTAAYGVRQVGADDINQFDGTVRVGSLGVGNAAAGNTPGTCVKKIQVYDASGNSLGFVPVYDAIS